MRARLFTFDIFGTVLDWKTGLENASAAAGRPLRSGEFDSIVDAQGMLEAERFRSYREITALSLVRVLGLPAAAADEIGSRVGEWPLFADSKLAVESLSKLAPCVAMTNSDRLHGEGVRRQTGPVFAQWMCAEDMRLYKPDPRFFLFVAQQRGITPGRDWVHVSAYADYDLDAAKRMGLTTVFVKRPHSRPAPADYTVNTLAELATLANSW